MNILRYFELPFYCTAGFIMAISFLYTFVGGGYGATTGERVLSFIIFLLCGVSISYVIEKGHNK